MTTTLARLADEVRSALAAQPRTLPPRWLYDANGSKLFDEITRLPEYYPYAAERAILEAHSGEIVATTMVPTIVELGSGTSEKTRLLLDAAIANGQLDRFVPFDVSKESLEEAAHRLRQAYPRLHIDPAAGDFTDDLGPLRSPSRKTVVFLGGTIGNFYPAERAEFLSNVGKLLLPGDWLLLGTDLVKSADRLIAAYDDSKGVTAEFIRNALRALNREMDADFDPYAFDYVPFWDSHEHRMDLRLRARNAQHIHITGAALDLDLASGEEIRMEISTKFTHSQVRAELAAADLSAHRTWTDPAGDFALTLAAPSRQDETRTLPDPASGIGRSVNRSWYDSSC
jgi:L-histidine N-alpha-methyltransferase